MPSALHLVSGLPAFQGRIRRSRGHLRLVQSPREMVGIQPSVASAWVKINTPLEGSLPFMYTDAENYVTTGMGNLVDPVGLALALPWRNPDGSLADAGTIEAQWQAVKNGGVNSSVNAGPLTTIRLDAAGINQAVQTTLAQNESILRGHYPNWDNLPADAQAAIMSMAWAMGPGFAGSFPQFTAAINAGNFAEAATQADFKGVGIENRIAMNKAMLANAQAVVDGGYDPSVLYWPSTPSAGAPSYSSPGSWTSSLVFKIAAGLTAAGAALGVAYVVADRPDLIKIPKLAW